MNRLILCVLLSLIAVSPSVQGQVQRKTSQKAVRQYTCPMHSAVKARSVGRCPKCGMNLVPVKAEKVADVVAPRKMSIPDVELLDHDGRKVHFYSDLVKGKTVAINFIFTTCTTICPPMGIRPAISPSPGRCPLAGDPATSQSSTILLRIA